MDIASQFSYAAGELFSFGSMYAIMVGVLCGLVAGALPGIGAASALAILFPITYPMDLNQGILFLLAVYTTAEYSGSIPAILIRTPGTGAAVATVLDGYPMARKGYARKALTISLTAGVFGSVFSAAVFALCAPLLALAGLQFGPIEMFAVGVFGLSVICGLVGKGVVKGFFAASVGLFLSTVGPSHFAGYRFTYGIPQLADGFPLMVMFIGFFAVPEALKMLAATEEEGEALNIVSRRDDWLSAREFFGMYKTLIRSTVIGTVVGIIPGAGAGVASFLAYAEERRWAKNPEEFGKGSPEGIAAPEAANNALVAGSIVPTLALGIPGSAAAALIMGLLIMKGVTPGPMLFQDSPQFTALIFCGLMVITMAMLVVGYATLNLCSLVTLVPASFMGPVTSVLILTGAYSYQNELSHLSMTLILGVVAYVFERIAVPTVPMVLAFIMGPIMEYYFNQALLIHQGNLLIFFSSPICVVILILSLFSAGYGLARELRSGKEPRP